MSAEVVAFPVSPRSTDAAVRPRLRAGDRVVTCINAGLGLWCAWPVALIDDDGAVLGVSTRSGKLLGVDRVNCAPDVYGFAARDHQTAGFEDLRWRTWPKAEAAVAAFARIGVAALS